MKLRLAARTEINVESLQEARSAFLRFIDTNGYGSSDLSRHAGRVTHNGKAVAIVSYNGRVWEPEGYWTAKSKEIVIYDSTPSTPYPERMFILSIDASPVERRTLHSTDPFDTIIGLAAQYPNIMTAEYAE
jgi:hypothetical protein